MSRPVAPVDTSMVDVDLHALLAKKNLYPRIIEQSLIDIVALDPNEIRPRTLSGSKESKPDYLRHKRSKSTDNKLDDLGFAVDPRTPSSIKANSFPRSSPLTLNKKGIVYILGQ